MTVFDPRSTSITVDCPTCGQSAGQRCIILSSGKVSYTPHALRADLALKSKDGGVKKEKPPPVTVTRDVRLRWLRERITLWESKERDLGFCRNLATMMITDGLYPSSTDLADISRSLRADLFEEARRVVIPKVSRIEPRRSRILGIEF